MAPWGVSPWQGGRKEEGVVGVVVWVGWGEGRGERSQEGRGARRGVPMLSFSDEFKPAGIRNLLATKGKIARKCYAKETKKRHGVVLRVQARLTPETLPQKRKL